MDPNVVDRVALLSIKPIYAEAIFAGRKTVEFRRSRLAPDIQFALVYATQPVGRIIGWFRIAGIAESTPQTLWRRFGKNGAISRRDYFSYFDGAERAYAIEVAEPVSLSESLLLESLAPRLRAPQSFQYLEAALVAPVIHARRRQSRSSGRLAVALA